MAAAVLEAAAGGGARLATEVGPAAEFRFWPAHEAHQQYLQKMGLPATKGSLEPIRCYGDRGPTKALRAKPDVVRVLQPAGKQELRRRQLAAAPAGPALAPSTVFSATVDGVPIFVYQAFVDGAYTHNGSYIHVPVTPDRPPAQVVVTLLDPEGPAPTAAALRPDPAAGPLLPQVAIHPAGPAAAAGSSFGFPVAGPMRAVLDLGGKPFTLSSFSFGLMVFAEFVRESPPGGHTAAAAASSSQLAASYSSSANIGRGGGSRSHCGGGRNAGGHGHPGAGRSVSRVLRPWSARAAVGRRRSLARRQGQPGALAVERHDVLPRGGRGSPRTLAVSHIPCSKCGLSSEHVGPNHLG